MLIIVTLRSCLLGGCTYSLYSLIPAYGKP